MPTTKRKTTENVTASMERGGVLCSGKGKSRRVRKPEPAEVGDRIAQRSAESFLSRYAEKMRRFSRDINRKKRLIIEAESLEEFLSFHPVDKRSYGKAYFRMRLASVIFTKVGHILSVVGRAVRALTWRAAVVILIAMAVYGAFPAVLSAPLVVSVGTKAEWERGTQTATTTLSSQDALQL